MQNRAGYFKANLSGEMTYNSFVPSLLPPSPAISLDESMTNILIKAEKQIALLEGISIRIPNISLFISMYVRKEALLSSQIEGTQATLEDILDPMIENNTNQDVSDVVNYIKALEFSIKRLQELPLCCRLIKETHEILMREVRGQEKSPGEFRHSQNWIGGQGSTLKNARYIPPSPDDMEIAMSDLEKYLNKEDDMNILIRTGLIHYQFETIHPFLDGNGRIGRLLITLFLMEKKVLTIPSLYISCFLKRNRIEYYGRMTEVRTKGNYEQWVKFFLEAIYETALDAVETIDELIHLYNKNTEIIKTLERSSKTAYKVYDYLQSNPIIDIGKTAQTLQLSYNAVANTVEKLISCGILIQSENKAKNRTFVYDEYVKLLRKGT